MSHTDDLPEPPPATRSSIPRPEPGPDEPYYLGHSPDEQLPELLETRNAPEWIAPMQFRDDEAVMPAQEAHAEYARLEAAGDVTKLARIRERFAN